MSLKKCIEDLREQNTQVISQTLDHVSEDYSAQNCVSMFYYLKETRDNFESLVPKEVTEFKAEMDKQTLMKRRR